VKKKIRIGNAGGYWGDDLDALRRQLEGGPLDYITMDFLAEITMSILRKQQLKNPALGYARDFLTQLETCLPLIVEKNVRVINNAGGINPIGLGREILALARRQGHDIKVGVCYGDDITGQLYELSAAGEKFTNMETGADFEGVRHRVTSANVYLGAEPVVAALDAGCQIIVTGRVLDEHGQPLPDTLLEIWQANAAGRYIHRVDRHDAPLDPNFFGAGRCITDSKGRYRFITIKPGAYPWGNHDNAWRPAHIHFSLFGPNLQSRLATQMYFPGDPLLPLDPILNSIPDPAARERLVARFSPDVSEPGHALGYEWDIVLRGPAQTPMEA